MERSRRPHRGAASDPEPLAWRAPPASDIDAGGRSYRPAPLSRPGWYSLFNVSSRGDVKAIQEQILTADYVVRGRRCRYCGIRVAHGLRKQPSGEETALRFLCQSAGTRSEFP